MWKKILLRLLAGEKNIPSPLNNEGIIFSTFVMVDKQSRMGFLWIWCSKTKKGINISRLKIPENIEYYDSETFANLEIPEIKFLNPSENGGGL